MSDSAELLRYIDRIRERTMRVAACVPAEKVDWTYAAGKFTIGDILRHLASIERWMFAENAALRPSRYPGHGPEIDDGLAGGLPAILDYMRRMHAESMEIFRAADFEAKTATPGGAELRVGKWLRAMIEHEVHHRGQIYLYLSMLGVPTPPLYGLTEEEVQKRSSLVAPRPA
jgi:uncharacterized damage-inducible protein DinB